MKRLGRVLDTVFPIALLWAVMFGFALWKDADWPETRRLDFALLFCIASFLVLLASVILRRMNGCDWLTISLASVFLTIACVRFYALGYWLWPHWFETNDRWLVQVLRASVVVTLIVATALLASTPDEDAH